MTPPEAPPVGARARSAGNATSLAPLAAYELHVRYAEVALTNYNLVHWNRSRVRKAAADLVATARAGWQPLPFGQILGYELQDCVDRAAEYFSPEAGLPLELFWTANRGVATFYSAISLGARRKGGYLTFGSLGSIGEGVALYLLEDRTTEPSLFSLDLMFRPLGDSPDMLLYREDVPGRIALAEAKATLSHDTTAALTEAVVTLIEVLKGWRSHRPLEHTDALAVVTSIHLEGHFHTDVMRLRWT